MCCMLHDCVVYIQVNGPVSTHPTRSLVRNKSVRKDDSFEYGAGDFNFSSVRRGDSETP